MTDAMIDGLAAQHGLEAREREQLAELVRRQGDLSLDTITAVLGAITTGTTGHLLDYELGVYREIERDVDGRGDRG